MADGWSNLSVITAERVQQIIVPIMAQATTEKGLFAVMKSLGAADGASATILPRLTEPEFNTAGNGASAYGSVKEVEPSVVAGRKISYTDLAVLSGTDVFIQARAGVSLEQMIRAKLEAYINLAQDEVEKLGAAHYANVATSGPDMRITTGATTTGLSADEIEQAATAADNAGHPVSGASYRRWMVISPSQKADLIASGVELDKSALGEVQNPGPRMTGRIGQFMGFDFYQSKNLTDTGGYRYALFGYSPLDADNPRASLYWQALDLSRSIMPGGIALSGGLMPGLVLAPEFNVRAGANHTLAMFSAGAQIAETHALGRIATRN